MNPQVKLDVIRKYVNLLRKHFGKKLLYGYLHLTNRTDHHGEDLYFVLEDGLNLFQIRDELHAMWQENKAAIPKPPIIIERRDFERYLQIFPGHAYHMAQNTKKLGPAPPLAERISVAPTSFQMQAWSCYQGMIASGVVAPKSDDSGIEAADSLLSQYTLLKGSAPDPQKEWKTLFLELVEVLPKGPNAEYDQPKEIPPTPITTLVASYSNLSKQIYVVGDIETAVSLTDWDSIWASLPQQIEVIQLTTPDRLRLAVDYYGSVDFRLMSYQKQWGTDLLENLDIQPVNLLQDAARPPMSIFVTEFLTELVKQPSTEEINRKIIHDFQNRLLNIRLQNELLGRLNIAPKTAPPFEIPPREAPTEERISAIYDHLTWWGRYYYELMLASV